MDESPTKNPLSGSELLRSESGDGETDPVLRTSMQRGPSLAYIQSKQRSTRTNQGALDFEYKDHGDETADIQMDLANSTAVTPIQKLRKIGKKTVSMAFCLLVFGTGMVISSFFYLKHINDGGKGFILFFMIGLCAIIPGIYATYNVIGKYNGWCVLLMYVFRDAILIHLRVGRDSKRNYHRMTGEYTFHRIRLSMDID